MNNKDKKITMSKNGNYMMVWNNDDNKSEVISISKGHSKWFRKQTTKLIKKDKKRGNFDTTWSQHEHQKSHIEVFLCDQIHPLVFDVMRSEECNHSSFEYNVLDHKGESLGFSGNLFNMTTHQYNQLEERMTENTSEEDCQNILNEIGVK